MMMNDDGSLFLFMQLYVLLIFYSRMMAALFSCFFQFSLHALGDSFSLTYNALSPKVCFATNQVQVLMNHNEVSMSCGRIDL